MHALDNAALFLVQVVFDVYVMAIWLRILLPWVNADYYHPISQLVIQTTNRPVQLLRTCFPKLRVIDSAVLALLLLVGIMKIWLLVVIQFHQFIPNPVAILMMSMADLLHNLTSFYVFLIIIRVIISWIQPNHHPLIQIVVELTEPVMEPVAKKLPLMAGFDFSPMVVIIGLQLINILLIAPLSHWGSSML